MISYQKPLRSVVRHDFPIEPYPGAESHLANYVNLTCVIRMNLLKIIRSLNWLHNHVPIQWYMLHKIFHPQNGHNNYSYNLLLSKYNSPMILVWAALEYHNNLHKHHSFSELSRYCPKLWILMKMRLMNISAIYVDNLSFLYTISFAVGRRFLRFLRYSYLIISII